MSHQLDTPLVAAKCVAGIVRHGGWTELMGHVLKPLRWRAHEAVLRCLDGSAGGAVKWIKDVHHINGKTIIG